MYRVKNIYSLIIAVAIVSSCFSCNRIKDKSEKIAEKAKNKAIVEKENIRDKIIPYYNSVTADTRFNKKRFEERFGFYPTPDVKEIYCYADVLGIDAKFQYSFKCDPSTFNRIIKEEGLEKDTSKNRMYIADEFAWWNDSTISTLAPYCKKSVDERFFIYMWYDAAERKAYYLDFDL
jgi:hypothetical protein